MVKKKKNNRKSQGCASVKIIHFACFLQQCGLAFFHGSPFEVLRVVGQKKKTDGRSEDVKKNGQAVKKKNTFNGVTVRFTTQGYSKKGHADRHRRKDKPPTAEARRNAATVLWLLTS